MKKTTVVQLKDIGQSIWIDNINRAMLQSGRLQEYLQSGVRGLTSNPTIFDKAVSSSNDYDESIEKMSGDGLSVLEIYDALTIKDIQAAADILSELYKSSCGKDGYVSLEINPDFAHDTVKTIVEGKRLAAAVNRPNCMVKVPATGAGYEAIACLLEEGINVNATLIFSGAQYHHTAQAFLRGLNRRLQKNATVDYVHSVASVFISRVDTVIDALLEERIKHESNARMKRLYRSLKGKAAVANALQIYKQYRELFSQEQFRRMEQRGANVQRVLWASTSTKNPDYKDTKYVQELIVRDSVNTVPESTLAAFLDHGRVEEITLDHDENTRVIDSLKDAGIDVENVCEGLSKDGLIAFQKSFESLLASIKNKSADLVGSAE